MDERTLVALQASIKHWEENLEKVKRGEKPSFGASDCALCNLFNTADTLSEDVCKGCPVRDKTGVKQCGNTPYHDAVSRRTVEDVQAELGFLKSLLPVQEESTMTDSTEDKREFSIDWPHGHVTRDGRKARIVCTDAEGPFPVIVLAKYASGNEALYTVTLKGSYHLDLGDTDYDLFNASAPVEKKSVFLNVYSGNGTQDCYGYAYNDYEAARYAQGRRLDVRIRIDYENGKPVSASIVEE